MTEGGSNVNENQGKSGGAGR